MKGNAACYIKAVMYEKHQANAEKKREKICCSQEVQVLGLLESEIFKGDIRPNLCVCLFVCLCVCMSAF